MTNAAMESSILLIDDGELDGVAGLLESQGRAFLRFRGTAIPRDIPPPQDLLIVTPRRMDRVRRGSPREAAPGCPLRIIAANEDSSAMRRRLRAAGAQLLVRLPTDDEIWRLLIARALYRGHERRQDPRINIGSPVSVSDAGPGIAPPQTMLIDVSNRGCRLHTTGHFCIDEPIAFTISPTGEDWDGDEEGLRVRGRIRRIIQNSGEPGQMIAMTFDDDLPRHVRSGLARLINRWASGPSASLRRPPVGAPAIPPCQLSSLPDLLLDDETDPPVSSQSKIQVRFSADAEPETDTSTAVGDRRGDPRGQFDSTVVAESCDGPMVLLGRDLSPGGMRVEAVSELRLGDQFRLALHGPGAIPPLIVHAEVVRDDGPDGFALTFLDVDTQTTRQIEKLVACLPEVESLERGEVGGIGAILSELIPV